MNDSAYKWLKEQENQKECRFGKLLGPSFVLENTDKYYGAKRILNLTNIEFYPSVFSGVLSVIIIWLFVGLLLMSMIKKMTIVWLVCVGCLFIHLVMHRRAIRKTKRKIEVNINGVQFDNEFFIPWSEIALTTILTKPVGRNKRKYLVIVTEKIAGLYERKDYELTDYFSWNPYGFASTISNSIESIR